MKAESCGNKWHSRGLIWQAKDLIFYYSQVTIYQ